MKNKSSMLAFGLLSKILLSACNPTSYTLNTAETSATAATNIPQQAENALPIGHVVDPESKGHKFYEAGKAQFEAGNVPLAEKLFLNASKEGNVSAYFALARLNHQRARDNADDQTARNKMLFYLRLAADRGHSKAQTMLGILYENSEFLNKDIDQAIRLYQAGALGGVAQAQFNLANILAQPNTRYQNFDQAFYWWQKAADQGITRAQSQLASLYYSGQQVRQDIQKAEMLWQSALASGDTSAMFGLAQIAENATPPNYDQSFALYSQALQGGVQRAALPLARHYRKGLGTPTSARLAFGLYQHAAQQGEAEAFRELGLMLINGIGTNRAPRAAAENLQKAYDLGDQAVLKPLVEQKLILGEKPRPLLQDYFRRIDSTSPVNLEYMLSLIDQFDLDFQLYATPEQQAQIRQLNAEKGDITLQKQLAAKAAAEGDVLEQEKWLSKASNAGDLEARFALSQLHRREGKAVWLELLKSAAHQEHAQSQHMLGMLHLAGTAVKQDDNRAYSWFQKAAKKQDAASAWQAYLLIETQADIISREGDLSAEQLLLFASENGMGAATLKRAMTERDLLHKQSLMQQAYDQGEIRAGFFLAEAEYFSPSRDTDLLKRLYAEAAELGNERSQYRLAMLQIFAEPITEILSEEAAKRRTDGWQNMLLLSTNAANSSVRADALWQTGLIYLHGDRGFSLAADLTAAKQQFETLKTLNVIRGETGLGLWAAASGLTDEARTFAEATRNDSFASLRYLWQAEAPSRDRDYRFAINGLSAALENFDALGREAIAQMVQERRQGYIVRNDVWAIYDQARDAGLGLTQQKNTTAAYQGYLLAAELGLTDAHMALGQYYLAYKSENPNAEKLAEAHFIRAIDQGSTAGMLALAQQIVSVSDRDAQIARNLWQQASEAGDALGSLYLAYALEQGIGGEKDAKRAFALYKALSEQNNAEANLNLARMYFQGSGTSQNRERGIELYLSLAAAGDSRAWLSLGKIFSNPAQTEEFDAQKASGYFLLAANSGLSESWYELGKLYDPEYQTGLIPDGFADAGLSYQYYQKAAELGISEAQYQLGLGYRHGYGNLTKDPLLAYAWFELAAQKGDIAASMVRDSIEVDFQEGDLDRIRAILETLQQQ